MTYRIFIAYRGSSQGLQFAEDLYEDIQTDIHYLEKYGGVYLSTKEELHENFITSIGRIMEHVEYFILPLTASFFDDFQKEGADSVTNIEIKLALKNKNLKFIAVEFPGYHGLKKEKDLLRELYGEDADRIYGCKSDPYDPARHMQFLHKIEDDLIREDYEVRKIQDFIHAPQKTPNVRLEFKRDTESPEAYPYYEKLYDTKKILLLNYAATTFLSGCDIATVYESQEYFRRRFYSRLIGGEIEVEAVLTRPDSYAAIDAEKYKMYPAGGIIEKKDIILHNLNKFYFMKEAHPDMKMKVYLTDIALSYSLMITEHENPMNDHMKVDIYAPVITDDRYRPSFYLLKNDPAATELYTRFRNSFEHIRDEYAESYPMHANTAWIRKGRPIIHRGIMDRTVRPHTKDAFFKCMEKGYPIEVDLLELTDGTILVGREDEIEKETGIAKAASMDYRKLNQELEEKNPNYAAQLLRFDDFLDLIHGRIPVLLEIKNSVYDPGDSGVQRIAKTVVEELRRYIRNYGQDGSRQNIAIHSANPYVLRAVRETNCMIPIGQISQDYDKRPYPVAQGVLEMHKNRNYFQVVIPDFISYNIDDLPDNSIQSACREYNIPLITWAVRSEREQEYAERYCDNYIAEKTYGSF